MGFDTIDSGFWDVEGGQDGQDTISSQLVESSHDQVDWWLVLNMSGIGLPPNAKWVNKVYSANELRFSRPQAVVSYK